MRRSLLPSMPAPKQDNKGLSGVCVGCMKPVGMVDSYQGTVIVGHSFAQTLTSTTLPIFGTMEALGTTYVLGGGTVDQARTVPYLNKRRGRVCLKCASNYR